jgi:hypothetical protein
MSTVVFFTMTRKLTITVSDEVYKGLREKIGPGKISRFLDRLARPYVIESALERAYARAAAVEDLTPSGCSSVCERARLAALYRRCDRNFGDPPRWGATGDTRDR